MTERNIRLPAIRGEPSGRGHPAEWIGTAVSGRPTFPGTVPQEAGKGGTCLYIGC